jgi:hypothetical protein
MFQVAMVRLIAGHYRRSGDDLAGEISAKET